MLHTELQFPRSNGERDPHAVHASLGHQDSRGFVHPHTRRKWLSAATDCSCRAQLFHQIHTMQHLGWGERWEKSVQVVLNKHLGQITRLHDAYFLYSTGNKTSRGTHIADVSHPSQQDDCESGEVWFFIHLWILFPVLRHGKARTEA